MPSDGTHLLGVFKERDSKKRAAIVRNDVIAELYTFIIR
jgi:hypothetical protein